MPSDDLARMHGAAARAPLSHKGTVRRSGWTFAAPASLVFCRMLPQSRSYDELVREFRWQVPAQFNIGVEVCDRWAERDPGKLAIVARGAGRPRAGRELRLAARDLEPARQCACGAWHRARRPRRDPAAAGARGRGDPYRDLQARRALRCRWRRCSAPTRIAYRLQNSGAKALITNAQGLAKIAEIRRTQAMRCRTSSWSCRSTGRATARSALRETLARASADFTPRRDRGRRSGDDDLHLGHHRPAQGRAACPSRADRPHAGHRDCRTSSSRSPATASGRRRTGPGPAACSIACCRASIAACRWWRGASTSSIRRRRSRVMARHGRAQRLHPADGAADAARGAEPARPPRHRAALGRLRRRGARRRDLRMGQGRARRRHQRVLRPDRMQPGASAPAPRSASSRPGAIGKADARPRRRGDRRGRPRRASRARSARSRCSGPTR